MDLLNSEDKVVTETKSVISRFYGGEHVFNKWVDGMFLPPVDNADQAKQRISVLVELLKPR